MTKTLRLTLETRGAKPRREIKDRLEALFLRERLGTINRMQRCYERAHGHRPSWNTLKKYAEQLREEGKVRRHLELPKRDGKRTVIYRSAL